MASIAMVVYQRVSWNLFVLLGKILTRNLLVFTIKCRAVHWICLFCWEYLDQKLADFYLLNLPLNQCSDI